MARVEQQSASAIAHELERSVADAFVEAGWEVAKEPSIGPLRPDLLLTNPEGEHFAVEVKASSAPVHFGTVAQVAEYASLAGAVENLPAVRSVLLTTAPLSVAARDAADKLGVLTLGQEEWGRREFDPAALARYWVHSLVSASEVPGKEIELRSTSAELAPLRKETVLALESSLAYRRTRIRWFFIGLVVLGLGIALAVVLAKQGFGDTHSTTTSVKKDGGAQASEANSSPLIPILIAIVVLAAISVGAYLYRVRRLHRGSHHSEGTV